ncbi:MAG TPA: hypothetical protein VJB14_07540 [Planctomycetota bacterium]|nr:hypothetical protein [Planctomycetota bacterium]
MNTILLALALFAAQDEPLPFPVFERDPWGLAGPGSSITRLGVTAKVRSEETITLKAVDKDSRTFTVSRPGKDDEEGAIKFVPFAESLISPEGGYKLSGKSNRQVAIGNRRVKALVREITPNGLALNVWRITTADEMPGGIVDITWKSEDDKAKVDVTYTMKGMEPIKAAGQTLECARIDLTLTETRKKKRKVEGSYWLSEKVPGLLVRSRLRDTTDKVVTETTMDVVKFELKKP